MRIKPGEPAKDFSRTDLFGGRVSLKDFEGKRLLLSFYRYASCPLCNLRVAAVRKAYPALREQGLEIVALFESPAESIRRYVGRQDLPFPVIADPDRTLYRLYGVKSSWAGFLKAMLWRRAADAYRAVVLHRFLPGKMEGEAAMIPADFLIGPDQRVEIAYYGSDIGDHLPIEKFQNALLCATDDAIAPIHRV